MKRLFTSAIYLLWSLLTFAQFSAYITDSQGVTYEANDDESTCCVHGLEDNYCATIVIPEVYEGRRVTSIEWHAFDGCSDLTSVTIPNSVTSIGWYAFRGCSGLTSITIPNSVTNIEGFAFQDCSGLTSITIPSSVTSIGGRAFEFCSGLTSITIPEGVTSIGDWAFSGCSGLTSIVVESGNSVYDSRENCNAIIETSENVLIAGCQNTIIPSSVTSIGGRAFYGCSGLTSITIPEGVTSIGDWAFYGCSGLTSITIPNSVTSIGSYAFDRCSSLTSITIPSSVTSIGDWAFYDCSGLTSITIPSSVTSIGDWAFSGCSGLTSVTIPNGVTSIGDGAFSSCSGLTSITIPNSVTSIGYNAFYGTTWYDNQPDGLVYAGKVAYSYKGTMPDNTKIVLEEGTLGIADHAFYNCSGLTSITIPNSVTSIGVFAFLNCSSLTSVAIPNSVTSIGISAFSLCSGLTSITIPNSVTSIGSYAFDRCSSLTSITIPNSVTNIEVGAFVGCGSLTNINVDQDNSTYDSRDNCNAIIETASNMMIAGCQNTVIPNSVTSIGVFAFCACSGLTTISIPNSVTSIGRLAFIDCSGLTSVTIPNSVTSIGRDAFSGCSGLTSITIPNSVTSIGYNAFYGTTWYDNQPDGLVYAGKVAYSYKGTMSDNTKIVLEEGTLGIAEDAFRACSNLTSITIPNSVTSIGDRAFWGCSGLTSVTVGWETPLGIEDNVFLSSNNQNATLYVPKGTKAAYEAANVWKDFGTIFECDLPQENVEATDVSAIDNVIYIDPLEVTRGTEVTVPLKMKNTAGVRGFQFDMYLPLGVTVKKDGNNCFICSLNDDRKPSGSEHTLTVNEQADGAIRFLCGSQYDETFTGTEGDILTVQLCVDEKMLAGLYPIILKNVKLTETNINNFYLTETVQTAMTVVPYIPGDISGDGVIDVRDYIGVANYILGTPQAGITAAAADVNKDNLVDVSDYIGVANLILYNNIYGQTANASRRWQKRVNTDVSALNNVVYITPFETTSNSETQVSVKMKNTVGIRGFQFDLYLPEGITAKKDGNNRIVCSLNNGRKPNGDQHTLTMSEQPDGAIRFLCGSQYDETFTGNDGEIATLTVSVAADVEADNYPIYLRNMKLTETDINNYYTTDEIETSVTVTGPADGRVVLDEASTTAPEAANGVDVRVKRTINANEWSTICLPFAMSVTQVKAAFGNDVQLGDFTSYDTVEDTGENVVGLTVNFNMVTAIEANHPYVIKVSNAISEFTADNVTIDPEEEPCVEYDNGLTGKKRVVWGSFTGTYVADCVIPYEGDDVSLFLSGNKWWYATAQTKHMKGYRAYFWFTDLLPDVSASRIQMAFNDETANVVELKDGRMEELKSYYNLKGQRVEKPLKKGLYIRNGKKVIIR